ncbi:bifunctional diguanylate cyclase/phosphodiesterase [Sphingopyxis sp. KK2]|uniref:putative bifunctional diguanylate cyclase/phosphodiesterase n=1 Tax=Sphingopyxis sp. KK2 TaxID=1855727 RepID=UPI00097E5B5A|nr:EAL domain-containing protein [Sphingopyxis sp. KK2]
MAPLQTAPPPEPFRRYFVRQVVQPIAIVVVLVAVIAALGLWWTTSKSNQVALDSQIASTRLALARSSEQLAYEQQSIATWEQLVEQSTRPSPDQAWLDVEIGAWLADVFGHDMSFILGPGDEPLYAYVAGQARRSPQSFEPFRAALSPLIVAARAGGERSANSLLRPDTVYAADAVALAGRPAVASVMRIGEGGTETNTDDRLIVSVRFIDGAYLRQVALWGDIDGLRFGDTPNALGSEAMVELKDRAGRRIGYFFWKPKLPGTEILKILGPLSLGLMLLLAAIMAMLVRSLWKSGNRLSSAMIDLRASEAQAQHLAFHDVLTGLPNRALFNDRLDQALARARRGRSFAVLAMDLDRFKQVNDTLGHAIGDLLIRSFASRLQRIVREVDTIARLGGDEFMVILSDAPKRRDVESICERILAAVREPFELGGSRAFVGISIGVVRVPDAGVDRGELIRKADIALYRAKSEGRSGYRIFTPCMDASVKMRAELEVDLRDALARGGELEVHYQPEVGPDGRTIVGMEALLRWNHPTRGSIPPERIIPIAEETGLIDHLDDFVFGEACRMAGRWPDLFIAVNLSAVRFRSEKLAEKIIAIAARGGCHPRQIELEITENVLLQDEEVARSILERLRAAGFRIALDDFGTGYSSLSYLRKFRVDKIKIDRSFTQNLTQDAEAAAIVASMVTLGHAIGLTVTAEGVENRDQMRLLSDAGCNELQGYLFARPMPEAEISKLLQLRRTAA